MLPARALGSARVALPRTVRSTARLSKQQTRLQSSSTNAGGASTSHVASGVAGGALVLLVGYGAYHFSAAGKLHRSLNSTLDGANKKYQQAAQKLQKSTPDADQTVNFLKEYCYSYASWVPGGRQVVDTAFKDIETIRQNHREEADQILNDAYKQLQAASTKGLTLDAVTKVYEVLADTTKRVGALAGDALTDVMDNHPQLKQQFGGSIDQLKQMGEQYGPEAKKQVDETWKQIKDVLAGGLSVSNLDKARKLIQEKVEQVKKLGDEAWQKGLEQAKPYLDKNPKVKETIEKNADALKKGNAKELFDQVRSAVESGDTSRFEEYVSKALDKAKAKGSDYGLDQYFNMIPNGSDILSKVQQLREVAEKHAGEGEKLLKETMDELKQVLEKKSKKAQEIAEKAKKEAK